jgi:hypothetical protein
MVDGKTKCGQKNKVRQKNNGEIARKTMEGEREKTIE